VAIVAKKREPVKVIIVNPESIPLVREKLTIELIKLQNKYLNKKYTKDELEGYYEKLTVN